jgi:Listeria/Bacterioides repeat
VGYNFGGIIKDCYAIGDVTGDEYIGGLVGRNSDITEITNCYTIGDVTGNEYFGGLVGRNNAGGIIANSYAKLSRQLNLIGFGEPAVYGGDVSKILGKLDSTWGEDIWGVSDNNYPYLSSLKKHTVTFEVEGFTPFTEMVNYGVCVMKPTVKVDIWYRDGVEYDFTTPVIENFTLTGTAKIDSADILKKLIPAAIVIAKEIIENSECDTEPVMPPKPTDIMFKNFPYQSLINTNISVHTVSFDSNGGTEVGNQTIGNGESAEKPEDPMREGYTFLGWCYNGNTVSKYDFTKRVTGDFTLVAMWAENP